MQISINGIPLLAGQAKAVAIAAAKLETELATKPLTGDPYKDEPNRALLTLIREVRDLIKCDGGT